MCRKCASDLERWTALVLRYRGRYDWQRLIGCLFRLKNNPSKAGDLPVFATSEATDQILGCVLPRAVNERMSWIWTTFSARLTILLMRPPPGLGNLAPKPETTNLPKNRYCCERPPA